MLDFVIFSHFPNEHYVGATAVKDGSKFFGRVTISFGGGGGGLGRGDSGRGEGGGGDWIGLDWGFALFGRTIPGSQATKPTWLVTLTCEGPQHA